MPGDRPTIAIIGGTGVYDPSQFRSVKTHKVATPYGEPSAPIEVGEYADRTVAFLPRHGKGHTLPPHRIPYRANIWALRELGVERIISPCAVGSLQERYAPGQLMFPDQFIDFTKRRDYSFYNGGKTVHISTADPFCPELRSIFFKAAKGLKLQAHGKGTYICIEGPRFSTRAESRMFRTFADIIGMTVVPEAQLALELEMCYVSIAQVTDYDVWAEKPVDVAEILRNLEKNQKNTQALLDRVIPSIPPKRTCPCRETLKGAEV